MVRNIAAKLSDLIKSNLVRTLKWLRGEGGGDGGGAWGVGGVLTLNFDFSINASSKERVKPWIFVAFNIIIRHTYPENFIEFPRVVHKI